MATGGDPDLSHESTQSGRSPHTCERAFLSGLWFAFAEQKKGRNEEEDKGRFLGFRNSSVHQKGKASAQSTGWEGPGILNVLHQLHRKMLSVYR